MDECHHDVFDLSEKKARKIIVKVPLSEFKICKNGQVFELTKADVDIMVAAGLTG